LEVKSPGALLDFGTGDFTIAIWIKSRNFGTATAGPQHIVGRGLGDGTIQKGYRLFFGWNEAKSHNLQLRIADGEASSITAQAKSGFYDARAGDWIMVAGVRDGDELRVYSDGVLYDTWSGAITTNIDVEEAFNDTFRVGASPYMAHHPFDGWLDELRVYTRALNDDEIAALAQLPE
ncbi:MAG: LamG domain-containing protein, partial [Polyangiaceae bacterium]